MVSHNYESNKRITVTKRNQVWPELKPSLSTARVELGQPFPQLFLCLSILEEPDE